MSAARRVSIVMAAAGLAVAALLTFQGGGYGGPTTAQCATQAPGAGGGPLTAALAKHVDTGLRGECACALGHDVVAVVCTPGSARSLRLAAPGYRSRQTRHAAVLTGPHALDADTIVTVRGLTGVRHAQLAVLYRYTGALLYARFAPLPPAARATVRASHTATGRLTVALVHGEHRVTAAVQRTVRTAGSPLAATRQPSTPPAEPAACGTSAVGAACSPSFDGLWHLEGPGWTGGDGALSVPLPDGRCVWLFGDTFLGTVGPDGTRTFDSPLVNNTMVVEDGAHVTTLSGPDDTAIIPPPRSGRWYWPGHGIVEGGMLRVFMHEFARVGPGTWDLGFVETRLASFSLPDLAFQGFDPVPSTSGVVWGNWVLDDGGWTYVYGSGLSSTSAFVARVPTGRLQGPWRFFDGSGWSATPTAVAAVADAVPNQYGVVKVAGGYSLVSMGTAFDPTIYARFAPTPAGPFGAPRALYTAPHAHTYVYGAAPHPEDAAGGRLLVSYSVNALRFDDLYLHPAYYRPRFVTVPLAALAG